MDSIAALLSQFGPYGIAAGFALMLLYRWYLSRGGAPIQIPAPNAPLPESERFPILSKIIKLFGSAKVADLSPEAIDAIRVELEDLAGMKHADLQAKVEAMQKVLKPAAPVSQAVKLQ